MLHFILFNRDMMINLYKLYFQQNKKFFIHPLFHPSNQTQMRETKIFSILSIFSILLLFYLSNQTNPYSFSTNHHHHHCLASQSPPTSIEQHSHHPPPRIILYQPPCQTKPNQQIHAKPKPKPKPHPNPKSKKKKIHSKKSKSKYHQSRNPPQTSSKPTH